MPEPFVMWAVYFDTTDHPGCYFARRWEIGNEPEPVPTEDTLADATLDGLRMQLPQGLYRMPRMQYDDPTIVETWF